MVFYVFPPSSTLVTSLDATPGSSKGSVDRLCGLCEGLHGALARADLLGRSCKRRSAILRTLFRLVDLNSARLDLCIARLCLAVSLRSPPECTPENVESRMSRVRMCVSLLISSAARQRKQPAEHLQAGLPDEPQRTQRRPLPGKLHPR